MPLPIIPLLPPFITRASLQPLDGYPSVQRLDVRFDADHFTPSLFSTLEIPMPVHLNRAVSKRRAEYLVSRYGLQQALASFGVERFVLGNAADRAPVWPQGITGSLSHTQQQVCALLTRDRNLLLGIDCEQIMTLSVGKETQSMLINQQERERLEQCSMPFNTALTVVFSLKESLYKALYPHLKQFMDFSAAEVVECHPDMRQVGLRLTQTFSAEMVTGRVFTGHAVLQSDRVLTWIVEPQPR
ncbi:4'-phosphopantetheinyl transferase family protein [Erwinia pyrifoliae]|uniref:Enterobactin synthase component D n=1 Tax=Erwinia pyrifoliae TaxID=79967 RepID=A0ABY5XBY2_ERWPY|nr:4'-phosphopantetheinyl transferase superfamily protein [Erwinia pyrifoliae]MCT2386659.1 4'-phosphopantetheinyl transferase superfamily protein [Erwinia pyrifoliae]MCU8587743.1 4'-phosphopantetheinyl transferase superfamily protein [Erwinia pyrifoliae]UWS31540.1 4'-phosphopantetheinyl transferase superfamily protein [Erwinia pyrifoliae]UWS34655.1 4'-phosphopantetheinyl transferase superfamily protein [Erwinia pyrifoliae]